MANRECTAFRMAVNGRVPPKGAPPFISLEHQRITVDSDRISTIAWQRIFIFLSVLSACNANTWSHIWWFQAMALL